MEIPNFYTSKPAMIGKSNCSLLGIEQPKENKIYNLDKCDSLIPTEISNERVMCEACCKTFSTKSSLTRHEERSPVCLKWLSINPDKRTFYSSNIIDILENTKKSVLSAKNNEVSCLHCDTVFSNIGNLHKHFKSATTCNQLAINLFLEHIKSLDL